MPAKQLARRKRQRALRWIVASSIAVSGAFVLEHDGSAQAGGSSTPAPAAPTAPKCAGNSCAPHPGGSSQKHCSDGQGADATHNPHCVSEQPSS